MKKERNPYIRKHPMKKKPKVYPNWMWPFYTLRKLKGRD